MNLYWSNLLAWSLQVAVIAAAGAALPWMLRMHAPGPKLWYWRVLLVACLALPLLEPWTAGSRAASEVTIATGQFRVAAEQNQAGIAISWSLVLASALAVGITLRLLWLAGGLVRLRRYRATASPMDTGDMDEAFTQLRRWIAPQAEILMSSEVSSPVTFGYHRPVILLPERFCDLPVEAQTSIVCHELIHIQRRDWVAAIAEELLRCVLWFHPAIWWLLGQIQLTREQVVDAAVIEHTGDRNRYLDALLAIASLKLNADLAPAPLFLKKRHLRQRVESIVSGVSMSKRNMLLSTAAAFAALPILIGVAAWQFPLRAAPQDVVDDPGVEVQMGAVKVLHRTGVGFPEEARTKHISGTVVVNVTTDDKGEVRNAVPVSGPEELRKAVVLSVLNWHLALDPNNPARTFELAVRFTAGPLAKEPPPMGPNTHSPRTISSINYLGLSPELRDRVVQSGLLHIGDTVTPDSFKTLESSLRNIDDHLRLNGSFNDDHLAIYVRLAGAPMPRSMNPPDASGNPPSTIRVGGGVQAANLIKKVAPKYPPEAKQARLQGTVRFNATIGPDGTIQNLEVISGHPMLVAASMDAVRQWVYKPTLLNGNPVTVMTTIDVNFTLTQ